MAKGKAPSKPSAITMPRTEQDYRVHDAVHTLKRAAEIKADPKLHSAAKEHAKHEANMLRKVAGRSSSGKD